MSPARARLQLRQPQFHCGRPPPAAAPSMRARKVIVVARALVSEQYFAVVFEFRAVHVDFHAALDFAERGFGPCHDRGPPRLCVVLTVSDCQITRSRATLIL